MIGIPTIDSAAHIFASLQHARGEITRCLDAYSVRWVICLNGQSRAPARREISRFLRALGAPQRGREVALSASLIELPRAGRNHALNALLAHARLHAARGIVHFLDDDVRLRAGSLRRNLDALVEHERRYRAPVLVGSVLRARRSTWSELRARHPSRARAAAVAAFQRVIAAPYRSRSEVPRFCEGFSFGAYVRYMPDYPPDETGITDDTYLSNYFAARGRDRLERDGVPPTLKPRDSIGFMELPHSYQEWRRQQVRIHAGIIRSFERFPQSRAFLERYFAWPYAFNPSSRSPRRPSTLAEAALDRAYLLLHQRNHLEARRLVDAGRQAPWGNAPSSKPARSSEMFLEGQAG